MIRVRYVTIEGDAPEPVAAAIRALALAAPSDDPTAELAPVSAPAPPPAPAVAPPESIETEPAGALLKLRFSDDERDLLDSKARAEGVKIQEWSRRTLLAAAVGKRAIFINPEADSDQPLASPAKAPEPSLSPAAELGRRGGLKGGPARAASLSPEERSASAKAAADKRWLRDLRGADQPHIIKEREFRAQVNKTFSFPAVPAPRERREGSIVDRILKAFGTDQNYPLPRLANEVYGQSTGETVQKLKYSIRALVYEGDLKKTGVASYRVVTPEERQTDAAEAEE